MRPVAVWIGRNPVRALAALQAVLATLAGVLPAPLMAAVLGVAAAVLGVGVHQAVTPVATAVENTVRAATVAATQVARDLDATLAGPVGLVTPVAERIVDQAITDAVR